ncbi:MAG TPA: hypothetical protein VGF25_08540 [Thermoleophilaceae bacterium]|jgi:hypothetical protein
MKARVAAIGLAACAALAAGCGDTDRTNEAQAPKKLTLAQRQAQLERNPYDLRCADIRDKVNSAEMTTIVQYALADDAQIRGLNRLQAAQSIFFAITELCRERNGGYRPADEAIRGVRSGEWRADLGTP